MVETMKLMRSVALLAALVMLVSCRPSTAVPTYGFRVAHSYPHDPTSFTEGLCYADGSLYEGTGREGQSALRKEDLTTGAVTKQHSLAPDLFGEGVAAYQDKIVQLTWQSHTGFVYDRNTFALLGQFSYDTEGWGVTWDDRRLIMSDGTATLYFLDPGTFQVVRRVEVHTPDGQPVTGLNELEYIKGEVFANVFPTNRIVRITPASGRVVGWIDLTGLLGDAAAGQPVDVLNGIAYDARTDRLFVTGKLWPLLFEIRLVRR